VTTQKSARRRGVDMDHDDNDRFGTAKSRIVGISAELFARSGYHATGIADLSKAVGLGKGSLYHYIGSKEAVLYEISIAQVATMNTFAEALEESEPDPVKRLGALAAGLMRNIADHRAAWTVFFREYHALTGLWRDDVVAARERYEAHWRTAIEQGVAEGRFKPQPTLIVKGLLGMFNYSYLWLDPRGGVSPEQVAGDFINTLMSGLATDRP
jgi:AcrR family transcriptional regulator